MEGGGGFHLLTCSRPLHPLQRTWNSSPPLPGPPHPPLPPHDTSPSLLLPPPTPPPSSHLMVPLPPDGQFGVLGQLLGGVRPRCGDEEDGCLTPRLTLHQHLGGGGSVRGGRWKIGVKEVRGGDPSSIAPCCRPPCSSPLLLLAPPPPTLTPAAAGAMDLMLRVAHTYALHAVCSRSGCTDLMTSSAWKGVTWGGRGGEGRGWLL